MITSTEWIQALGLVPHPEGGYYREFYRSKYILNQEWLPSGFTGKREMGSVIHYMLTNDRCSAFHRLKSDEIWHFHDGSPFVLHLIDPKGVYSVVHLGINVAAGEVPCFAVPAGHWFGAEVAEENSFSLASCTVIPAFNFDDFEMPATDELIGIFPHLAKEIRHLSRTDS
ncbi:hypothetical protein DRQ21_10750 [Candidatus Fermentibacteria bacterium]|nr:MAG: hypothetical protein DRQ21_10750 [Candidatus Fermentibacteria bacterium]